MRNWCGRALRRGVVLWIGALLACSKQPAMESRGDGARTVAPAESAAAAAPADGVLAEVKGATGPIRVEQRAGRRLLYINGTLHASIAWAGDRPSPAAADPLVALLRAARPAARTVLVIGLGSGATAGELAGAGLDVTAVEIDPAVINVATKWFGYRGKAVTGDGRAYLEKNRGPWDLVIMDAFDGLNAPPKLVDSQGLALLRERTAPAGATALRMYGPPGDAAVTKIRQSLRGSGGPGFGHLYGSGVGAEAQNLYVLAAAAPLNIVAIPGAAIWPLPDDLATLGAIAPGQPADRTSPPAAARTVTLVGYVHRLAGGELALDLSHAEMGAVRYLLAGKAAEPLAAGLPPGARFPTQGDISSDGDTSKTLRPLLGGGGAKRSDVRFSPLVAAITGSAKLLAVVHPDAASRVPSRGGAATDERIPYGGALYELTVGAVHWTMSQPAWSKLAPELDRRVAAAAKAASRADLAAAATELSAWSDTLAGKLGDQAELVAAVRSGRDLAGAMTRERDRAKASGTPFAAGAACDRLHSKYPAAPPAVVTGLYKCAVAQYERSAATDQGANGYDAAARLVFLLDPVRFPDSRGEPRRRALMKKFKISQPMMFPPGSI